MKLGILGGTFNPIHFGHLRAAEEVRDRLNIDKIIFMPSGNPPLKASGLVEASHRYAMTRLATSSNVNFVVSDIEVRKTEKSYTADTLENLHQMYPEDDLIFIIGLDAFLDLPNWWQPEKLTGMADFAVMTRPGFDLSDIEKSPYISPTVGELKAPTVAEAEDRPYTEFRILNSGKKVIPVRITSLDISSTTIRRLVKEGRSIRYLLPETVEQYIREYDLYRQD